MQLSPYGKHLVYNRFDRATGQLIDIDYCSVAGASTGHLYNQYMRYNATGVGRWEMWWDQTLYWYFTGDAGTRILKGYQANVVVESNDYTEEHFEDFSTRIGGLFYYQGVFYPLAATGFLRFRDKMHQLEEHTWAARYLEHGAVWVVNPLQVTGKIPSD